MDAWRTGAWSAFAAGIALLLVGASRGEVQVALVLVFPVILARGLLPALGVGLILLAGVLAFVAAARSAARRMGEELARATEAPDAAGREPEEPRPRTGGFVLVGPIPIAWGSDRRVLPWLVAAGVALLLIALAITWATR